MLTGYVGKSLSISTNENKNNFLDKGKLLVLKMATLKMNAKVTSLPYKVGVLEKVYANLKINTKEKL